MCGDALCDDPDDDCEGDYWLVKNQHEQNEHFWLARELSKLPTHGFWQSISDSYNYKEPKGLLVQTDTI